MLISLQALLSCPNPDDPQDGVVASQYKRDRKLFEATAKEWTQKYASGKVSCYTGRSHRSFLACVTGG